ncbi:MAG TPA: phage portal protein [Thermomicrobiaceae bacterium]|nr:phage portal protein [Thermomicrobiaceae bacterium]
MSWIEPVVRELMGDNAATDHKLKFFENGATPNMVVSTDLDLDEKQFGDWVDLMSNQYEGVENAYRTFYLAKGGNAQVVGANLRQIDFKATQGAGETRLAAAAGIPPVIAGFSEGLQGSSLNAGNFGAARRNCADGTMRPTWASACGSLETIVPPPNSAAELWYDETQIAWLREDEADAADIAAKRADRMHTLISAGFKPDSVVAATIADDDSLLQHSGMYSVQLRGAGTVTEGKGSTVSGVPEPADGSQP